MNGYVMFETPDGETLAVNADRVSAVRRFRGGIAASAINFEKGHYAVVKGSIDEVVQRLAEG
jgi:uncharacterized protein YlzI (FlbEa/FlbD family)